jgi:hypothetical protein
VYAGLRPDQSAALAVGNGNIENQVVIGDNGILLTVAPALSKPTSLWTGKQIVSSC